MNPCAQSFVRFNRIFSPVFASSGIRFNYASLSFQSILSAVVHSRPSGCSVCRLRVNSVSFYCSAGAKVQARLAQFCADCVRSCNLEGKTKILLEHHCGDCRGKFIS